MEKSKTESSQEIPSLIRLSLKPLEEQNKGAFHMLVSMADEGFFESHQTSGAVRKIAKEIVKTLNRETPDHES